MSTVTHPISLDLLARLRQAVWDLECSCPDRPELSRIYEILDSLQEQLDAAAADQHNL